MLCLICGLPNAGKTTYSQQFDNVIHLDDEMRTSKVCEKVKLLNDCVVEGTFNTVGQRKRVIEAYEGDYCKCIFIDISLEESIRRENRGRKRFILENASKSFRPPTLDEGWDEIIIIRGEHEQRISRQTED